MTRFWGHVDKDGQVDKKGRQPDRLPLGEGTFRQNRAKQDERSRE